MSSKLKIKIGTVLTRPVMQQTQNGMMVTSYAFVDALTKLGEDPLPFKERYAVARTLKEVQDWLTLVEKARNKFIETHGVRQSQILTDQLAALQAEPVRGGSIGELQMVKRKRMVDQLAIFKMQPHLDQMALPADDTQVKKEFDSMMEEMAATEFEFEYLDHKIALVEGTKLTAVEIMVLEEIIAEP